MVVLDEGHYARNNLSQVKEQLMAIRTPLRVMLSGATPQFLLVPGFRKQIAWRCTELFSNVINLLVTICFSFLTVK